MCKPNERAPSFIFKQIEENHGRTVLQESRKLVSQYSTIEKQFSHVITVFSWSPVFFLTSFICIFANKKCVTVVRMLPGLGSETSTLIKIHRRTLF